MRTFISECSTHTSAVPDFVDITTNVEAAVTESGLTEGQVTIFSPDTDCVLIVNEREKGLLSDIKSTLERLGLSHPERGTTMIGSTSVVLPASEGKLRLGAWQRLLLVELKEAGPRSVIVQVVGE